MRGLSAIGYQLSASDASCSITKTAPGRTPTAESRQRICLIARQWLGTPYHHMGRVKGAGVDCAMFPLEVYREAGLIGDVEVPYYPQDWMLHRSDEIYLGIVQSLASELQRFEAALPGDFVLYHFGRTWSHGAIVLEWPLIIHAVVQHGVILSDGEKEGMLVGRKRRFFAIPDGVRGICAIPDEHRIGTSEQDSTTAVEETENYMPACAPVWS